jgi:hypothetical protein
VKTDQRRKRPSPNGQGAGGPGDAGRPEGRLPGCNTAVLETLTAAPNAGRLKLQSSRHGGLCAPAHHHKHLGREVACYFLSS